MPIELYPNIAKVKRNGVYQNLPGFVQASGDADIEAMIANSETSTTAQFNHDKNTYFILNGVLYQADENILVNDTIAVGTNCHVEVLSNDVAENITNIEELKTIKDTYFDDGSLLKYLYKENTYINASNVETALTGYNLYKIPVKANDVVYITWTGADFWNALTRKYVADLYDGSYTSIDNTISASYKYGGFLPYSLNRPIKAFITDCGKTNAQYLFICSYAEYAKNVTVKKYPTPWFSSNNTFKKTDFGVILDEYNAIKSPTVMDGSNRFDYFSSPDDYYSLIIKGKAGDKLIFNAPSDIPVKLASIVSLATQTVVPAGTKEYTLLNDALIITYYSVALGNTTEYIPCDTPKINAKDISRMVAGAIRNEGSGWEFIDNSGHTPLNCSSVSVNGNGEIEIGFSFTATKVISFVIATDETFAQTYTIGASVGLNKATCSVYQNGTKIDASEISSQYGNFWFIGIFV